MQRYEYRVIAAPTRGLKAKGIKTAEARFSHALEDAMNTMAAQGWEYQRAETLPSTERSGLTSTTTKWRNVLVFRRPLASAQTTVVPVAAAEIVADAPEVDDLPDVPPPDKVQDSSTQPNGASGTAQDKEDDASTDIAGVTTSSTPSDEYQNKDKSGG